MVLPPAPFFDLKGEAFGTAWHSSNPVEPFGPQGEVRSPESDLGAIPSR